MDDYADPKLLTYDGPEIEKKSGPRWVLRIVGVAVVLGLIAIGVLYWLDARHYQSTDDAFIDAHISQVSAQISGRVTGLLVQDNQMVQAGEPLVQIDPRDYQVKLDQMIGQRDQAAAQLAQARATVPQRQADLDQATANIRVSQADLFQNQRDLTRYSTINPHAISQQALDNARAGTNSAQAKLDAAKQAQTGMRAQLAVAATQVTAAEAALRTADANVADAKLQLSYTQLVAPAAGRVTKRTVEVGNYVNPGQSLLAIVQPACWVTANYKERQLEKMRPGQKATMVIDAFPDAKPAAHVDSLQNGTGSVFSSLPAENATGNYVKIVQRLPVKIVFDDQSCIKLALAPGMSVVPRVRID